MANTYTQIYIHIVFAVKGRQNLIHHDHKVEIHKYISGIISKRGQKPLAVHCMPDHVHIFIGMKPDICISDLTRDIKAGSSGYINKQGWVNQKFQWQLGFGAFTYSHSHISRVINYINNQEAHHRGRSFRDEYLALLRRYRVAFNDKYLFEFIE